MAPDGQPLEDPYDDEVDEVDEEDEEDEDVHHWALTVDTTPVKNRHMTAKTISFRTDFLSITFSFHKFNR